MHDVVGLQKTLGDNEKAIPIGDFFVPGFGPYIKGCSTCCQSAQFYLLSAHQEGEFISSRSSICSCAGPSNVQKGE